MSALDTLMNETLTLYARKNEAWYVQLAEHLKYTQQLTNEAGYAYTVLIHALGEALDAGHTCLLDGEFNSVINEQLPFLIQQGLVVEAQHARMHIAPVVIEHLNTHLYFYRQWLAETQLAKAIDTFLNSIATTVFASPEISSTLNEQQQQAMFTALNYPLCIITGGPGTGKTYTLVHIVKQLQQQSSQSPLRIALAAPTGKAAQRMQSLITEQFNAAELELAHISPATTIHRLLNLGSSYRSPVHLPYDVVVIDEASMLDLDLAHTLFEAIAPPTRLILLGDANQLSAVEAGAVLRELTATPRLDALHCVLTQSRRFSTQSGIGQLAECVLNGVLNEVDLQNNPQVHWQHFADMLQNNAPRSALYQQALSAFYSTLRQGYQAYFTLLHKHIQHPFTPEQAQSVLDVFNQYRILTPLHQGAYGTLAINAAFDAWAHHHLTQPSKPKLPTQTIWYNGKPVMLIQNTPQLGLSNGDIGICIWFGEQWQLFFATDKLFPVAWLDWSLLQTAYAMTVHKSQGSEFERIAIILPPVSSSSETAISILMSRELVYTAITRAKSYIHLWSNLTDIQTAITQHSIRHSGLADKIDRLAFK